MATATARVLAERVPGFSREYSGLFALPGSEGEVKRPSIHSPESELVRYLEGCFMSAQEYQANTLAMIERFRTNLAWFLSSSPVNGYSPRTQQTVINMLLEKVEKIAADTTADDPEAIFLPMDRADVEFTELMNPAFQHIWNRNSLDVEFYRVAKAVGIFGTTYLGVFHDPGYGISGGNERVVPIMPWNLLPPPYYTEIESSPWVIHHRWRSVADVFADTGVAVEPELQIRDMQVRIEELIRQQPFVSTVYTATTSQAGVFSPTPQAVPAIPDTWFGPHGGSGLVLQKDMYLRDGGTEPKYWWKNIEGQGVPELARTRSLRYPKGRLLSWANGKLLVDAPNPYQDGHFPFVKFVDGSIPDFWYGMGEVEPLVNAQLFFDDVWWIFKQILAFTASGRLIVDERTGLTEGDIGNLPGEIWYVNEGTVDGIQWFRGEGFPPSMFEVLNHLMRGVDTQSGSTDVTRGVNPTGVTAGNALVALQQLAGVRMRARFKEHRKPLAMLARLIASRVQQFWPSTKTLRVLGKELATDDRQTRVQFRDFVLNERARQAAFEVQVKPGINQEDMIRSEFERASLLFQAGLISDESFVRASGLSSVHKYLLELPVLRAMRAVPAPAPPAPTPRSR